MSPTVIAWLSLIVAIIGGVIYFALTETKRAAVAQLALYAWAAGLLAWLLHVDHIKALF